MTDEERAALFLKAKAVVLPQRRTGEVARAMDVAAWAAFEALRDHVGLARRGTMSPGELEAGLQALDEAVKALSGVGVRTIPPPLSEEELTKFILAAEVMLG